MSVVKVKGSFLGANLKKSTFEGVTKVSVMIDVYQPDAPGTDKVVQIKSDDVELLQTINENFDMGSVFEALTSVNAYQNKAYFKLLEIV